MKWQWKDVSMQKSLVDNRIGLEQVSIYITEFVDGSVCM